MTKQEIIQNIFSEYNPLENIEHKLFKQQRENEFSSFVNDKLDDLDKEIQTRIKAEIFHWGPITSLLEKEDLFDIIIQGPHNIFYETSTGMHRLDDYFLSDISFQNFIERLCHETKIVINQKTPFANGKFKNFRVHISTPPASQNVNITLRKHNTKTISLHQLMEQSFLNLKQKEWVSRIIREKKNFLVIGATGSGKTTFINSILNALPPTERVVITEDTDELINPNPISTKLLSREIGPETLDKFSMDELVKQCLRMRPDRIVVGEVRGVEAKDLLQALATGHSGSMGTLHAHSAQQALIRLEMLIQMGAPQWSLYSIRQLIRMSLDYLIVLNENRLNKGIKNVFQIGGLESFGLLLEEVDF